MNPTDLTPTQRLLKITAGPYTLGTATLSASFIQNLQQGAIACVCVNTPGSSSGQIIATCGPADDPASNREAVLFAAAPELFDACQLLTDFLNEPLNQALLNHYPRLTPLLRIYEAAKAATVKAIIGDQPIEQALAAM